MATTPTKQNNAAIKSGGTSLISEMKSLFSIIKTRRTAAFAYGFMFAFVAFTVFLAFNPNSNSAAPWFSNIFTTTTSTSTSSDSASGSQQFSSFFSSFFYPNASSSSLSSSRSSNTTLIKQPSNITKPIVNSDTPTVSSPNQTASSASKNNTSILPPKTPVKNNQTQTTPVSKANKTTTSFSSSPKGEYEKKQSKQSSVSVEKDELLLKSLLSCDLFHGEWVEDDSYPLYEPGSCPLIDEQFNCIRNGRPDKAYQRFKWQPKDCTLPR